MFYQGAFLQLPFTKHSLKLVFAYELMGKSHQCAPVSQITAAPAAPEQYADLAHMASLAQQQALLGALGNKPGNKHLMKLPFPLQRLQSSLVRRACSMMSVSHRGILGCSWEPLNARAS